MELHSHAHTHSKQGGANKVFLRNILISLFHKRLKILFFHLFLISLQLATQAVHICTD